MKRRARLTQSGRNTRASLAAVRLTRARLMLSRRAVSKKRRAARAVTPNVAEGAVGARSNGAAAEIGRATRPLTQSRCSVSVGRLGGVDQWSLLKSGRRERIQ